MEATEQFPVHKWGVQERLVQLKNVIKLQDRAIKHAKFRALKRCKQQAKIVKNLEKENDFHRKTLDVNIKGDEARRRTTMRNNRNYQLAYQRLSTQTILDNLSQVIFNKTKIMDKLRYEKTSTEDTLLKLKLQLYEMTNAKKFVMKTWKEQEIANKIQNMLVKQKAAQTVKDSYEKMIKILKDDSQTFDKSLENLKSDRLIQAKCILKATQMGQKATEDLGLLRDEYKVEEKNILTLMKKMDMSAKSIKAELERVTGNCRNVIRTESTQFGNSKADEDDDEQDNESILEGILMKDVNDLEGSLQKLKSATEVLTFDEIYPRIEQQIRQKIRLLKQVQIKEMARDKLLDQRNQLEALLENLEHTMVETTEWYREEKHRLIAESKYLDEECKKADEAKEKTGAIILCIRMGLLSLSRKLDRIDTTSKYDILHASLEDETALGVLSTLPLPETDAMDILANVNRKMELLVHQIKSIDFLLSFEIYVKSKRAFELKIISKNIIEQKEDEYELAMTEMLEELGAVEDPSVPTRADIKQKSAKIVEIFGTERIVPEGKSRSRMKRFKKK